MALMETTAGQDRVAVVDFHLAHPGTLHDLFVRDEVLPDEADLIHRIVFDCGLRSG